MKKQVFIYFDVSTSRQKEFVSALIKNKAMPAQGWGSVWAIRQNEVSLPELRDELTKLIGEKDKLLITEVVNWESCNVIP